MYTEKSIILKSDFYSRYGNTTGALYFEKTATPCPILDGGDSLVMFGFDCGVSAYGRAYGDILKVMDSNSNECEIRFVSHGKGAQILYKVDMPGLQGTNAHIGYTVNKLLRRMGREAGSDDGQDLLFLCDKYAPKGWCAYSVDGKIKSMPMPLGDYNVILTRTRKHRVASDLDLWEQFKKGERERIKVLEKSLKECRLNNFFEAVRLSEASIERLLCPSRELLSVVRGADSADGVMASRICDMGVVSFCRKEHTDHAIHTIINECGRELGYAVNASVVK